ncbi:serine hydrolase [Pleionea sp. CnH1-48]|uniref:serine hydrolase domain-containing protein n=1 Tax=Pleionea sp. CnH1-48 TaxID=2954494 RepID=UPI002097B408|nr:serine hydrolase domain-containing protein [Pleionea sp. CnH1-48]MCO7223675.1 beta-lactamase family protein [Pleionea sp. CnH1-48]
MKKALVLFISTLCLNNGFTAEKQLDVHTQKEIARLASQELASTGTPSLQISIGYKDRIVYEDAFGFSDLENKVPASTKTKYRTASIAKWFTATSAMALAEEGKLDLDTPIQTYCPQFPEKQRKVTTRQLLTHTAGIRGYLDFSKLSEETQDLKELENLRKKELQEKLSQQTRYQDVITPLDVFKNDPLIFEPDTNWSYTSLGYRILACVMQGASGQKFRTLLKMSIFEKAKMNNTLADDAWAIIPHRAAGYRLNRDKTIRRADSRDVSENLPAGGYLSTSSDLVKFALTFNDSFILPKTKSLMTSPVLNESLDIKSKKSWRDAMPHKSRYGYGIMLWSKYVPGMIGHTGRQAGASSILILIPSKDLSIAVMTNAKGWNGYLNFTMKIVEAIEKSGGVASLSHKKHQ